METKIQIIELFYNQHLKEVEIAEKLSVSQPYVHKIVKQDKRHLKERLNRKAENMEKRALYLAEYQKNYSRPRKEDIIYEAMKLQHIKDVMALSSEITISNDTYRKYNPNAYTYNSKTKRIEIVKGLKVSKDIPKYISTKRELKTQKYKKPYYALNY